jgi:hypothetical protein
MTAAGTGQASVLVDVASLTAAVAALVVAVVALYLTALRRAEVEVDLVPTANALSGAAPAQLLDVMLFVSNTGIHGGVLRDIRIDGFQGKPPRPWTGLVHSGVKVHGADGPPVVLGAGAGTTVTLTARLTSGDRSAEIPSHVDLTIKWTFVRTPGFLPRPARRRQEISRSTRITVPTVVKRASSP